MTRLEEWLPLVGAVTGTPAADVAGRLGDTSFVALGGSSLDAIELLALGQRHLRSSVDSARLIGPEPLGTVLAAATPYLAPPPPADPEPDRPLLPGQRVMLAAHLAGTDRPYHLMFSLETPDPLDEDRTTAALAELVARHESLRTMFVADGTAQCRRVLPPTERPRILRQHLPSVHSVQTAHELYARASDALLRPFERPPVVFVLGRAGRGSVLTMLVHHVLADGWSIGLLWRQFGELYRGEAAAPGRSPDQVADRHAELRSSGALDEITARAVDRLAGAPTVVSLPADAPRPPESDGRGARLVFPLPEPLATATGALAARCGVTTTAVLMTAWALTVARRTGLTDLLLGLPVSGRFGAGTAGVVGLCTRVVPVRCRIDDGDSAEACVRGISAAIAAATGGADVPFEHLVAALGEDPDPARNPVAQIGFAAHDQLVPEWIGPGWRVHEGHCGGSVFDALLYVQAWSGGPRLALEYATSVLSPADAGDLAESFEAGLTELTAYPRRRLGRARTISADQRARLDRLGTGTPVDSDGDLWHAFERAAAAAPDAVAISDTHADVTLTYAQLHGFASAQARQLAEAGVEAGDRVLIDLPRSASEAVGVLATLCLGASYVAIDPAATREWRTHVLATAAPKARIGPETAIDLTGPVPAGRPLPEVTGKTAYIAYTSGSTGLPKGVVVTHRGVLRLAADPDLFVPAADTRMLRMAPLAFDASTLELLVPLVRGDTVEVYPPGEPAPAALAGFLHDRPVTHVWLTSGLFRIVAEHRPDAFRGVRQLFTGGGVVSPPHVRRVLDHCPGLRVTNGYGPTENTTFTTTHTVDGAHQVGPDLPIGRPVAGTGVVLLDAGGGLVPPGGLGELHTTGAGLADGYLDDPARTGEVFTGPPSTGLRTYRTGDLARWGTDGTLHFHGRHDRQVKIAGHRVELADVERRIASRDGVLDALVFLSGEDRLCAAVRTGGASLATIRQAVEAELPAYARPQRWLPVTEFPLTRNGKVDLRALSAETLPALATTTAEDDVAALEKVIADAWTTVLGTDDFDHDEAFFDVGGDSLRLALVRHQLRERLPEQPLPLVDLYRFPTVESLARHLAGIDT
ncbi:AMP-binding protein [Amycolatopsis sp. NPDC021455]|uniref:AMP-binding protein n=1 Tax=Amycolatopsis sp. NPDC021455 TaxID=3154901 RepID=UPI0033E20AF5